MTPIGGYCDQINGFDPTSCVTGTECGYRITVMGVVVPRSCNASHTISIGNVCGDSLDPLDRNVNVCAYGLICADSPGLPPKCQLP